MTASCAAAAATADETRAVGPELRAGEFAPPNPYAREIAAIRAAEATSESRFEEQYKARRLREFEAEWRRIGIRNS
jgi:hypothetical protein